MEIKFTIINIASIFEMLGKTEQAKAIDSLYKEYPMPVTASESYGLRRCIFNYIGDFNYDFRTSNPNCVLLEKYITEELFDELFYIKSDDTIDVSYSLSKVSNQQEFISRINLGWDIQTASMSKRFYSNLHEIVCDSDLPEKDLFRHELTNINKMRMSILSDRNFDAKEVETEEFQISYLPKGKSCKISGDDKWSVQNRTKSKFVKGIKKLPFRYTYSNTFYEKLNNLVVAHYTVVTKFIVVDGYDIVKYYKENSYSSKNTASLQDSCMRYDHCSEYIKFYAENKDVVKMLVSLDNDDKVVGRALLWTADCGTKIMDRIYGTEVTVEKFKKWAIENDYIHKQYQSYSEIDTWVSNEGNFSNDEYEITVKNIRTMPYMDTFKFTQDISGDTMVLNNSDGSYEFTNTDGNIECFEDEGDYVYCEISDERLHIDDAYYVESTSSYYHERYVVYCEDIQGYELEDDCIPVGDNWYTSDSVTYIDHPESKYNGEYVLNEDAVWVDGDRYTCHIDESSYDELNQEEKFALGNWLEVEVTKLHETFTYNVYSGWYRDNEELVSNFLEALSDVSLIKIGSEEVYKLEEVVNE